MNHSQALPLLMTGVMSFAAGVLLDGIAQDARPRPIVAECTYTAPQVERDILRPEIINKVCAHLEATGRGHLCRRVEG